MISPIQFSIILPLFNKEENIGKTIETVLNQTYKYFELIIVNDGSTDNSLKIANEFKSKSVHIINQQNKGVSSARNTGIKAASYPYIGFIDGDDFWEKTFLEEMVKFIVEFPLASVYGSAFDRIGNGNIFNIDFGFPIGFKGIVESYFSRENGGWLFWPTTTIIKKEAIKATGLFDERISIGEDIDLWFRLALDHKVAFYNKVFAHYNLDGINRAMQRKHDFDKSIYYYTWKYRAYENTHKDFKRYINVFRISNLKMVYTEFHTTKKERKEYLSLIDVKMVNVKLRTLLYLPFFLKDLIIRFKYK